MDQLGHTDPKLALRLYARAMRRDGTHVVTLNTLPVTGIDWSPDGTRLAYSDGNVAIGVVDINARGDLEIAGADGTTSMLTPTWSPQSCEVMFTEIELGIARLTTARADGTGFATDWRGGTWGPADWSFAAAPVDVPGDRAPRVEMLDPDGGELLVPGDTYTLRWQADDDQGIVETDLHLLVNGTRIPIATGLAGGMSSYAWTVPAEPADSTALVQVAARDAGGQEHRSTSKHGFSIAGPGDPYQRLRLTAPAGGEALRAGEVFRIAWEADRDSIFTADDFHLELSVDGGVTYRAYINDFVPGTDRSYDWTVPDLRRRAKELGLDGYSGKRKSELISMLRNH